MVAKCAALVKQNLHRCVGGRGTVTPGGTSKCSAHTCGLLASLQHECDAILLIKSCAALCRRHTPSHGVLLAIQAGSRQLASSLPNASGAPHTTAGQQTLECHVQSARVVVRAEGEVFCPATLLKGNCAHHTPAHAADVAKSLLYLSASAARLAGATVHDVGGSQYGNGHFHWEKSLWFSGTYAQYRVPMQRL